MGKISVVGVGPGSRRFLTPEAEKVINSAEVLVGGREILRRFRAKEKKVVGRDIGEVIRFIREKKDRGVAVLTSGDPCFYSLLAVILREFPKEEVEIIPGISSMQLCFAKIKEPMNDATLVSLHGRGLAELEKAAQSRKLVILTDSSNPANVVADYMLKHYPRSWRVYVCENLSREDERVTQGSLQDIAREKFDGNAVMVAIYEDEKISRRVVPGVQDEVFYREGEPITKEEVRVVTLSKACLKENSVVYDIGAGTGSISVEAAFLARRGKVYAVEKDEKRGEVIKKNISKFGLTNVEVLVGEAPEVLEDLPPADSIIIGGSGGRLRDILRKCDEKIAEDGRIVLNLITIDSLTQAFEELEKMGYRYGVTQLTVSKGEKLGGKLALRPHSMVFIIDAWRARE